MLKILAKFSDIVSSYKISKFEHIGLIIRFRAELTLTDNTILRDLCITAQIIRSRHTGESRYPVLSSTSWIPDQVRNDE